MKEKRCYQMRAIDVVVVVVSVSQIKRCTVKTSNIKRPADLHIYDTKNPRMLFAH